MIGLDHRDLVLRLKSMDAVNNQEQRASDLEAFADRLDGWSRVANLAQISLGILGLIVVLLKDLPIWETLRRSGELRPPILPHE